MAAVDRKVPKEFHIFGQKIKIEYTDTLSSTEELYGYYKGGELLIKVKKDLTYDLKMQTVWHEIVHCVFDHVGLRKLSEDETIVDLVGQALYQVTKTLK